MPLAALQPNRQVWEFRTNNATFLRMGTSARDAGRFARRAEVERKRAEAAAAAAESDHPLNRLQNAPTALSRLYAMKDARDFLDLWELALVSELRANLVPWSKLGVALGVSGQAVQKRWSDRLND